MAHTSSEESYAFANALAVQRERLSALEAVLDPGTIRHLDSLGVGSGWSCLEVGAGGGSIAAWLCDRVGAGGRVLATDLDCTALGELTRPNLEIRVHDVLRDELPREEFDLIHLRLLLAWLDEPAEALARIRAALKPGGLLLAEEMDFVSVAPVPRVGEQNAAVFARVMTAHNIVLAANHAFDPFYGRRLAGELAEAGVEEVFAEGRATMWRGGETSGRLMRLTLEQLRDSLDESGLLERGDLERAIELLEDPDFSFLSQVTVAAWGRRPA